MKLFLAFFLTIILSSNIFGQCPNPGDTLFLSFQSEIEDFDFNYAACDLSEVEVVIGSLGGGSNITSLIALGSLNVAGSVTIANTQLTNLNGLGLNLIGGNFTIMDNTLLTTLNGLNPGIGLDGSGNFLIISNNPVLDNIQPIGTLMPNNPVSFIEVSNNDSLTDLSGLEIFDQTSDITIANNDQLTSLDGLENMAEITNFVNISGNPNLLNISALNGLLEPDFDLTIQDNTFLNFCSEPFVCQVFLQNKEFQIGNNAEGCNSRGEIKFFCDPGNLNIIEGTLLYDADNNGCSPADLSLEQIIISAKDVNERLFRTVTDAAGEYRMIVPLSTYEVTIDESSLPAVFQSNPLATFVNFTTYGNMEVVDFCVTASTMVTDVNILLLPISEARPGFISHYQLSYQNIGTVIESGEISLQFNDAKQEFVEATPAPTSVSNGLITWSYQDLLPFQFGEIQLSLQNFTPPTNEGGDELPFDAIITTQGTDQDLSNNSYSMKQVMVNSFDPNDKTVNQGPEIFVSQVGDYLDYLVRFQNVGSASAIHVYIEDILANELDWDSFRMIASSHPFVLELNDGNQAAFIFENINLPPESVDPEGSNGFVAFQLKSDASLQIGDMVQNTADIYFDFNPPIITNTVTTTVIDNLGVATNKLERLVAVFPNPVSEVLQLKMADEVGYLHSTLFSILGEQLLITSEEKIDMSNLATGIYFVRIVTQKGEITKKVVKE